MDYEYKGVAFRIFYFLPNPPPPANGDCAGVVVDCPNPNPPPPPPPPIPAVVLVRAEPPNAFVDCPNKDGVAEVDGGFAPPNKDDDCCCWG